MGKFGIWQLVIILVIFIMVFGLGKLPQVGESIGKSIRSFKKAQSDDEIEDDDTQPVVKKPRAKKKKVQDEDSIM